jgi:hypothetical protein
VASWDTSPRTVREDTPPHGQSRIPRKSTLSSTAPHRHVSRRCNNCGLTVVHRPVCLSIQEGQKNPTTWEANDTPFLWVTSGSADYLNHLRYFYLKPWVGPFRTKVVLIGLTTTTQVCRLWFFSPKFPLPQPERKKGTSQKPSEYPKVLDLLLQ